MSRPEYEILKILVANQPALLLLCSAFSAIVFVSRSNVCTFYGILICRNEPSNNAPNPPTYTEAWRGTIAPRSASGSSIEAECIARFTGPMPENVTSAARLRWRRRSSRVVCECRKSTCHALPQSSAGGRLAAARSRDSDNAFIVEKRCQVTKAKTFPNDPGSQFCCLKGTSVEHATHGGGFGRRSRHKPVEGGRAANACRRERLARIVETASSGRRAMLERSAVAERRGPRWSASRRLALPPRGQADQSCRLRLVAGRRRRLAPQRTRKSAAAWLSSKSGPVFRHRHAFRARRGGSHAD